MLGKSLLIFSAVALAAAPGSAEAPSNAVATGSQPRSDLKTRSDDAGYYPGRRSFYNYPRHRHIDGGGEGRGSFSRPLTGSEDRSANFDGNHGSAYYGPNYGAPYFGGAYYDGGIYYRERRD